MHFKQLASLAVLPLLVIAIPTRLTVSIEIDKTSSSTPETAHHFVQDVTPPSTLNFSTAFNLFSGYQKTLETTSKLVYALKYPGDIPGDDDIWGEYGWNVSAIGNSIRDQTAALKAVTNECLEGQEKYSKADSEQWANIVLKVFGGLNETFVNPLVQHAQAGLQGAYTSDWTYPLRDLITITNSFRYDGTNNLADDTFLQSMVTTVSYAGRAMSIGSVLIRHNKGWADAPPSAERKLNEQQGRLGL